MAAGDIRNLWKLHLVDSAILEIRSKAAALDPGKRILAEVDVLNKALAERGGRAHALGGEQTDLELQQKAIDEKLKKIDKALYGGQIVNPREVEGFQKEIAALKKQRDTNDARILELWELVPPARAEAERVEAAIAEKKRELAEHQKKVMQAKQQLEAAFKEKTAARSTLAKEMPPNPLAKYESVRQKHGGIGMSKINLKSGTCEACGTLLPEKLIEAAKDEKLVTCEACYRILYYTEGLV